MDGVIISGSGTTEKRPASSSFIFPYATCVRLTAPEVAKRTKKVRRHSTGIMTVCPSFAEHGSRQISRVARRLLGGLTEEADEPRPRNHIGWDNRSKLKLKERTELKRVAAIPFEDPARIVTMNLVRPSFSSTASAAIVEGWPWQVGFPRTEWHFWPPVSNFVQGAVRRNGHHPENIVEVSGEIELDILGNLQIKEGDWLSFVAQIVNTMKYPHAVIQFEFMNQQAANTWTSISQ